MSTKNNDDIESIISMSSPKIVNQGVKIIEGKKPPANAPHYEFKCLCRYWQRNADTGQPLKNATSAVEFTVRVPSLDMMKEYTIKEKLTEDIGPDGELEKKTIRKDYYNFLGFIRKRAAPKILTASIPEFFRIHSLVILSIEPRNKAPEVDIPIQFLSKEKLAGYCKVMQIGIDPSDYKNVVDFRNAVLKYKQNPGSFFKDREEELAKTKLKEAFEEWNDI